MKKAPNSHIEIFKEVHFSASCTVVYLPLCWINIHSSEVVLSVPVDRFLQY
nr:MAG TPA: hypothetical protein [Caudoviricetes sp.]